MRKITLVCFGRLKTPGLQEAVTEFEKRLSRYVDFETLELKPMPVPDKSTHERARIQQKEADLLIELLQSPGFKIKAGKTPVLWCLDETGMGLPTREWSSRIKDLETSPNDLVLLIGGSLGLGDTILKKCHSKWSLGPQTLSHELARLVLIEQLYRALSYNAGHPYHNEG